MQSGSSVCVQFKDLLQNTAPQSVIYYFITFDCELKPLVYGTDGIKKLHSIVDVDSNDSDEDEDDSDEDEDEHKYASKYTE